MRQARQTRARQTCQNVINARASNAGNTVRTWNVVSCVKDSRRHFCDTSSNFTLKRSVQTLCSNPLFKRFVQTLCSNALFKRFQKAFHSNFKRYIQTVHSIYLLHLNAKCFTQMLDHPQLFTGAFQGCLSRNDKHLALFLRAGRAWFTHYFTDCFTGCFIAYFNASFTGYFNAYLGVYYRYPLLSRVVEASTTARYCFHFTFTDVLTEISIVLTPQTRTCLETLSGIRARRFFPENSPLVPWKPPRQTANFRCPPAGLMLDCRISGRDQREFLVG